MRYGTQLANLGKAASSLTFGGSEQLHARLDHLGTARQVYPNLEELLVGVVRRGTRAPHLLMHKAPACSHPLNSSTLARSVGRGRCAVGFLYAEGVPVHQTTTQNICHCLEATMWVCWETLGHEHGPENVAERIEDVERVPMVRNEQERVARSSIVENHRTHPTTEHVLQLRAPVWPPRDQIQQDIKDAEPSWPDWQSGVLYQLLHIGNFYSSLRRACSSLQRRCVSCSSQESGIRANLCRKVSWQRLASESPQGGRCSRGGQSSGEG
mmetsp:Transcript_54986/g.155837  ORF Transcript_54986/g.155837 Transcript_54986/m.155837 type:complete len:268 (-) Transcript_54986:54-857(-)